MRGTPQAHTGFLACRSNVREDEKGVDVPLERRGLAIRTTMEFLLSPTCAAAAATQFFQKTLGVAHRSPLVSSPSIKTQPTQKHSTNSRKRTLCLIAANCGRSNTSTPSSNRTTGSANGWPNQGWASFHFRQQGKRYEDRK